MTETADRASVRPTTDSGEAAPPLPLPRWKKVLLIGAGVLVVVGLALLPFRAEGDLSTSQGGEVGALGQSFDGERAPDGVRTSEDDLAPTFLKLGFSFFVGFAIGYAFRAFLKLALIILGVQLLALFGLQAIGWVTVEWDIMAHAWDGFVANVSHQFESIRGFISGSLPQASLASLGLFAGFKRN